MGVGSVHLLEEVEHDIIAGRSKPMDEFLAEAKAECEYSKTSK